MKSNEFLLVVNPQVGKGRGLAFFELFGKTGFGAGKIFKR